MTGVLSKAAFKIEGGYIEGAGLIGSSYPIQPGTGNNITLWDTDAAIFTTDIYAWLAHPNNTIANVGNTLEITYVDDQAGAYVYLKDAADLNSDLTVGDRYRLQCDASYTGGNPGVKLLIVRTTTEIVSDALTGSTVTYKLDFTADHATTNKFELKSMDTNNVVTIDNISLVKIGGNADDEEVKLGGSDKIPFLSESVEEDHTFELDETLAGTPGITQSDRVGLMGGGSIEIQGMYDGLDAIIACAMGFELPNATGSPTYKNSTALTVNVGGLANNTWLDSGIPFVAGDLGKFIRVTNGVGEGQVRRIIQYLNTEAVDIETAGDGVIWDQNPAAGDTAEMAREFVHTFELANQLKDEKFSVMDDTQNWTYPTGGVGTDNDQIIRRGTYGVDKLGSKPWIWRSCMVNSITFAVSSGGSLKVTAELIPFDLDRDSGTNTASSTWEWDNNSPLFSPAENERTIFPHLTYIRIGAFSTGAPLDSSDNMSINDFSITINNNIKADDQDAITGVYRVEPTRGGFREITGSLSIPRYEDDIFADWLTNKTILMAYIQFEGSIFPTDKRGLNIFICSMELTSPSRPVGGADVIAQTYGFRALIPTGQPNGFPTQNQDSPRSEVMIQTINHNPFNMFRDQNREY